MDNGLVEHVGASLGMTQSMKIDNCLPLFSRLIKPTANSTHAFLLQVDGEIWRYLLDSRTVTAESALVGLPSFTDC
jgi:hypothetical protein